MRRLVLLAALAGLSACTTSTGAGYPSLAVREVERATGSFTPPPAHAPLPPTGPEVLDRLDKLGSDAAGAHRAFLAAAPAARSAVNAARGGGVTSEAWALAQVALAGLESSRAQATVALADLDRLFVDAATGEAETARIAAVRETVAAQVAEEDAAIDALLRALG